METSSPGAQTPNTPHSSWGPFSWGSRSCVSRPSPRILVTLPILPLVCPLLQIVVLDGVIGVLIAVHGLGRHGIGVLLRPAVQHQPDDRSDPHTEDAEEHQEVPEGGTEGELRVGLAEGGHQQRDDDAEQGTPDQEHLHLRGPADHQGAAVQAIRHRGARAGPARIWRGPDRPWPVRIRCAGFVCRGARGGVRGTVGGKSHAFHGTWHNGPNPPWVGHARRCGGGATGRGCGRR
ncbi:hypothetical protein ACFFX0_12515 [Citricoccus parietis]|uniref:Uncharacterized protein n=1 Tax=Citricoccus parietis TaxID=592307 RepID=A0ABV5FZ73_9MICC